MISTSHMQYLVEKETYYEQYQLSKANSLRISAANFSNNNFDLND